MSRWFRFYDDAVNDPKVQRLAPELFKAWVNILCIVSKAGGALPPVAEVAFTLRVKVSKAQIYITALTVAGLLDCNGDGTFGAHNWDARQFKSDVSNDRVKQYRERKRNVTPTVTVTAPETEQKQITEAEQKDIPLRSDDWPKDFGDVFWKAYPRKTEKLSAMKKLAVVRKSGIVTFSDLLAGVHRYAIANKSTDPKYVKHPTSWLNAGCWADETHTGGTNGHGSFNAKHRSASDSFFAGIASVAADIDGDRPAPRPAEPEVPLGRVNIDL